MIDLNGDYTGLLKYNSLMNPKQPQPVKAASVRWVQECLESCGWVEGDKIPNGLGAYLDAVIKECGLAVSPKSAKEVIQIPIVKQTLTAALAATKDFTDLDKKAEDEVRKILGDAPDLGNSVLKQLYDITKTSAKKTLEEEQRRSVEPEVVEQKPVEIPPKLVDTKEAETILKEIPNRLPLVEKNRPEYAFCPCCGISLTETYQPNPITDEDRKLFLQYVLGGQRFYKTYPLWGGQVEVTLKTMTPEEERLFDEEYNQYCLAHAANFNQMLVRRSFTRYKMAGLLHQISFEGISRPTIEAPSIFDSRFDPKDGETRVGNFLSKWYDTVITSVEMQRALDSVLDSYFLDIDNLRKHLYNQDFWNGGILA